MGTALAVVFLGLAGMAAVQVGGWRDVAVALSLVVAAAVVAISVWTSRLWVEDDRLMARNFYGTSSLPLDDIVGAEPATLPLLGIVVRTGDGRRMRSLVSGEAGDELWKARAAKICDDILHVVHRHRSGKAG